MSFKFFRKHQKVMLWVIVVITILTFSIFSVTSTMKACFRQSTKDYGQFVSMSGDEVTISQKEYRHTSVLYRQFNNLGLLPLFELKTDPNRAITPQDVMTHIILYNEANEAGIKVSDGEINAILTNLGLTRSKENYLRMISRFQFGSPKNFEEGLRELAIVHKFKQLYKLSDKIILSEDLYEEFKVENEEFRLAYIPFTYISYADKVDAASIKAEELKTWFDGLAMIDRDVKDYFSEPEKVEFDVVYLDLNEVKPEDFEDVTAEVTFEDRDVMQLYYESKERFRLDEDEAGDKEESGENQEKGEEDKDKNPDEEKDAEPGQDEAAGEDKDTEKSKEDPDGDIEEEDTAKYRPFEEVKEQLEKECKLVKLVEKAHSEWVEYVREKDIIGKDLSKEPEEEPEDKTEPAPEESEKSGENDKGTGEQGEMTPESPEEEESIVKEEEKTPDEFFDSLVSKYHLSRDKVTGPVSVEDLPGLERYGSELLKRNANSLKLNNSSFFKPCEDHPSLAYFIRVTTRIERRKMEIAEVQDKAMERYLRKKMADLAQKDAKDFLEALKEKCRGLDDVKGTIDQYTKTAMEKADERISKKQDITDEDKEKIRSEELRKINPTIDQLLSRNLFKPFDEEAAARGFTVKEIDYFSKAIFRTPEFREMEDSAEKYLMGNRVTFDLGTNGITDPLHHEAVDSWFVARVLDRRFPSPDSMTEEDYLSQRQVKERQIMMQKKYPQYFQEEKKEDPFAFEKIQADFQLKTIVSEEEESSEKSDQGEGKPSSQMDKGEPSKKDEEQK